MFDDNISVFENFAFEWILLSEAPLLWAFCVNVPVELSNL